MSDRRFPFLTLPGEEKKVRAAINDAIISVDDMIYAAIRRRNIRCPHQVEDVAQAVRVHLATHALPRFDATAKTKVATYLYPVINRAVASQLRSATRAEARNREVEFRAGDTSTFHATDTSVDRNIEAISADVRSNPEKYLTADQARVFRAMIDVAPGRSMSTICAERGIHHRHRTPAKLAAIRQRIMDSVDIDAGVE
jgi:DNA-directed RNA polymerase specialized sigma subunit